MSIFPLHIFPTGILSDSVFVCIWAGAFVVIFFNTRFGWPLSGLVAPGYLAPLILLKPWLAASIIFDAICTYFITYIISKVAAKLKYWHSFFGRDYFFLIMLTSILVRIVFDKSVYPTLGEFINHHWHLQFDYKNNLHSFGVVIIALLANSFWNAGLKRSFPPLIINIVVTALFVRYVLMVFTNFSLSNLNHIYTDIAIYLDATPKSYIVLLVTGYVASYYNLFYAWGYNGILIPALLALQWHDPLRIIVSLIEAGILYLFVKFLRYIKIIKQNYFEGSQRILIFFTVALFYKILASYLFGQILMLKMTDYLGFGYMLTTLIALRIYDKDPYLRIFRSMVQLLLIAIVTSTVVGYSLTLIPRKVDTAAGIKMLSLSPKLEHIDGTWIHYFKQQQFTVYHELLQDPSLITKSDARHLLNAFQSLNQYANTHNTMYLNQAIMQAVKIDYKIQLVNKSLVTLTPRHSAKSMGQYFININTPSNSAVIISQKSAVEPLFLFGSIMTKQIKARYYLVAPTDNNKAIRFRQYVISHAPITLIEKNLSNSKKLILRFSKSSSSTNTSDISNLSFTNNKKTIFVSHQWREKILTNKVYKTLPPTLIKNHTSLSQHLNQRSQHMPTVAGTQEYTPPTLAELLYLDLNVVDPLVKALLKPTSKNKEIFSHINTRAELLGYELIYLYDQVHNRKYLILQKDLNKKNKHYWGTYVFNLQKPKSFIIEIPRPYYELNTLDIGTEIYQGLDALSLLVSDTHPYTELQGKSDVILTQNLSTLFTLVHQVLLRETHQNYLTIHIRGFRETEGQNLPKSNMVVSFRSAIPEEGDIKNEEQILLKTIKGLGYSVTVARGGLETAGLSTTLPAQAKYLRLSNRSQLVEVWLSPLLRSHHRKEILSPLIQRQLSAVNIPVKNTDLT